MEKKRQRQIRWQWLNRRHHRNGDDLDSNGYCKKLVAVGGNGNYGECAKCSGGGCGDHLPLWEGVRVIPG